MKNLIFILTSVSTFSQTLSQIPPSSNNSYIEGLCIYHYDFHGRYSCALHNARILNPSDVLVIIGTHQAGYTDDDVQAVYHRNVTMIYFNGEILRKFVNVKFLHTFDHQITFIHENAFESCGQLEEFQINANLVSVFPSGMLKNCENLKIFDARQSRQLEAITEDLFGGTRNLEEFYISGHQLTSINDNLLQNMANLRIFNIQGSRIQWLSPKNFINATNLQIINLSFNNFQDPTNVMNVLNGHTSLRKINLINNEFSMFNFHFFSQFTNLEELFVDTARGQNLTIISWQFLPSSLMTLHVTQIGENIPENAFFGLQNLRFLTLRGLGITILKKDTFRMSKKLEILSITDTSIRSLDPQLFMAQANLRTLIMSRNQIEELPDKIFEPLVNLGLNHLSDFLLLSNNKIRRLSANSFGQHPYLQSIYFDSNEINEIQRGIFSRFGDVLQTADFRFNRCINASFLRDTNLDESPILERCFSNFDGPSMTTTEAATTPGGPDGCGRIEVGFGVFVAVLGVQLFMMR